MLFHTWIKWKETNNQQTLKWSRKFTKIGSGESFSPLTGSGSGSGSSSGSGSLSGWGSNTGTGAFSRGFGSFLATTFPAAKVFASCGWKGENGLFLHQEPQLEGRHSQNSWISIVTFFRGSLACGCSLTLLPMSPRAVLGLSPGLEVAAEATGTRFAPAILIFALFSALIFVFCKKQDESGSWPRHVKISQGLKRGKKKKQQKKLRPSEGKPTVNGFPGETGVPGSTLSLWQVSFLLEPLRSPIEGLRAQSPPDLKYHGNRKSLQLQAPSLSLREEDCAIGGSPLGSSNTFYKRFPVYPPSAPSPQLVQGPSASLLHLSLSVRLPPKLSQYVRGPPTAFLLSKFAPTVGELQQGKQGEETQESGEPRLFTNRSSSPWWSGAPWLPLYQARQQLRGEKQSTGAPTSRGPWSHH